MKYTAVVLLCCVLAGCSDTASVAPGSCAELFDGVRLTDLDGREARVSCQGHKVLIVNFWAPWCGPCKLEIPYLVEIAQQYASQGVQVVGISLDDTAVYLKAAVAGFKITYPVLTGSAEKVFARTGIDGIPATLIIAADGRIDKALVGFHTKEEVLEHVRKLLNAKETP